MAVKVTADDTIAHHSCPKGCAMDIECPVKVEFTAEKKDMITSQLIGRAIIDTQPVWDHVLFFHGADDPESE